jgi:hypothetical protein
MKLIEEIKKAEEKAENLKKKADTEGLNLIEAAEEEGKKKLNTLGQEEENLIKKKRKAAKEAADKDIAKLEQEHNTALKNLKHTYQKNKAKAIKKAQDLIISWPLSQ